MVILHLYQLDNREYVKLRDASNGEKNKWDGLNRVASTLIKKPKKKQTQQPEAPVIPKELTERVEKWKQFRMKSFREQQEAIELMEWEKSKSRILDEDALLVESNIEPGYEIFTLNSLLSEEESLAQTTLESINNLDRGLLEELFGKDLEWLRAKALKEDINVFDFRDGCYETILKAKEGVSENEEVRPLREWWDVVLRSRAFEDNYPLKQKEHHKSNADNETVTTDSDEPSVNSSTTAGSESSYRSWMSWMTERLHNGKHILANVVEGPGDRCRAVATRDDLPTAQRLKTLQPDDGLTPEDSFGNRWEEMRRRVEEMRQKVEQRRRIVNSGEHQDEAIKFLEWKKSESGAVEGAAILVQRGQDFGCEIIRFDSIVSKQETLAKTLWENIKEFDRRNLENSFPTARTKDTAIFDFREGRYETILKAAEENSPKCEVPIAPNDDDTAILDFREGCYETILKPDEVAKNETVESSSRPAFAKSIFRSRTLERILLVKNKDSKN